MKVGYTSPMAAKEVARSKEGRCSACKRMRNVDVQEALGQVDEAFTHYLAEHFPASPSRRGLIRDYARGEPIRWYWACDPCVRARLAIVADPTKQAAGVDLPFAAYVNRPFRCTDCAQESVFSAKEQKHWFEVLGFLTCVHPKQCAPCRKARRALKQTHASLGEALNGLNPKDPEQLETIARLYEKLGREEKAKIFRARANNRRRAYRSLVSSSAPASRREHCIASAPP